MTELDEQGIERAVHAMQGNHMLDWRRQAEIVIKAYLTEPPIWPGYQTMLAIYGMSDWTQVDHDRTRRGMLEDPIVKAAIEFRDKERSAGGAIYAKIVIDTVNEAGL